MIVRYVAEKKTPVHREIIVDDNLTLDELGVVVQLAVEREEGMDLETYDTSNHLLRWGVVGKGSVKREDGSKE